MEDASNPITNVTGDITASPEPNVTVQTSEPAVPTKPPELDPYLLFTQIEEMKKDGVEESVIREAFNQLMEERSGQFRKIVPTVRRKQAGLPPMISQEEINKIYTDRVTVQQESLSPSMLMLMDEVAKAKDRRIELENAKPPRPTLKMYAYRLAYYGMNRLIGVIVYLFNKAGIK